MDRLLTTTQAAEELGLSRRRINRLITDGALPAERMGHIWVVRQSDLDKLERRPPGRPPKRGGADHG